MEKIRLLLFIGILAAMLTSCSKKNQPTPTPIPTPPDTTVVPPPAKTVLQAPANNQPCIVGAAVSGTQSKVTFTWAQGANTDSYEVHIKNLVTGDSTVVLTTKLTLDVNLALATPYSWHIIAKEKKSATSTPSDTWKFYNSGPGVSVFPPYPAEAVYPGNAQYVSLAPGSDTGDITLKWKTTAGSSPITEYAVYSSTVLDELNQYNEIPHLSADSVTINVSSGTRYYWKVVSTDAAGNTSTSQVFDYYVE